MGKLIDETGNVYGRLTVLYRGEGRGKRDRVAWICQCECGAVVSVNSTKLRSGHTKSCGCLRREVTGNMRRSHGLTDHPLYGVWKSMKERCYNQSSNPYKNYGGRGIAVCDEWLSDFQQFYNDCMTLGWEPGLTIDRINNDGNYCFGNCRFVDRLTQMRNTRHNRIVEIDGEKMCLSEAVERYATEGLTYHQVSGRITKYGWPVEAALTLPSGQGHRIVGINGEKMCLAKAVERHSDLQYSTVKSRIHSGWPAEAALTLPKGSRNPSRK